MIERKTIVSKLEIDGINTLSIQLGLLLIEDDVEIGRTFHRTSVACDASIEDQLVVVNEHLLQMKQKSISEDDIKRICDLHAFINA